MIGLLNEKIYPKAKGVCLLVGFLRKYYVGFLRFQVFHFCYLSIFANLKNLSLGGEKLSLSLSTGSVLLQTSTAIFTSSTILCPQQPSSSLISHINVSVTTSSNAERLSVLVSPQDLRNTQKNTLHYQVPFSLG